VHRSEPRYLVRLQVAIDNNSSFQQLVNAENVGVLETDIAGAKNGLNVGDCDRSAFRNGSYTTA
jgi:hypothetical protein